MLIVIFVILSQLEELGSAMYPFSEEQLNSKNTNHGQAVVYVLPYFRSGRGWALVITTFICACSKELHKHLRVSSSNMIDTTSTLSTYLYQIAQIV